MFTASLLWMLFSPSGDVFKLAGSALCVQHQTPLITLIIRAKKNCVAYFEAQTPEKKGPGRPPEYGEKVQLLELSQSLTFVSIHNNTFETSASDVFSANTDVALG